MHSTNLIRATLLVGLLGVPLQAPGRLGLSSHGALSQRGRLNGQASCTVPDSVTGLENRFRLARVVPLQVPDTTPFGSVDFVKISPSGNSMLVDRADYSLKLFDSEGSFIRTIGKRGRGTGGFERLADAAFIDDSLIVALDDGLFRMVFFDLEGNALRENALQIRPVGGVDAYDSVIVVAGLGPLGPVTRTPVDSLYSIHFLSLGGEVILRALRTPPSFSARPEAAVQRIPLLDVSESPSGATTVFVTWLVDDEIVEIGVDGHTLRVAHLPENEHFVRAEQSLDTLSDRSLRELLFHTSPVIRVIASRSLVVVGYFAAFKGEGQVRYNVYDRRLRLIVSDTSGPPLYTARGDTLIGLRRAPVGTALRRQMIYLVPCPSLTAATK